MIFVAVGTQLPFDRLIQAVDSWAGAAPGREVMAQIAAGSYLPQHVRWERNLAPSAFQECLENSDLVVAHAGIGTILSALELGKPVIVLPRRCSLGEHRNDHQLATASRFGARRLVQVAKDEQELRNLLDEFAVPVSSQKISGTASPELLANLRKFIEMAVPRQNSEPS
ncbi:MAG: glucuronosyltransferase [Planctomycetes bacterium]|nr:glucuronosyltransferase [Planctomycetota bacterium]